MEEDLMARSGTPQTEASLGDLVAQAAKDISQLIHYEIDLAKSELKVDVRRLAVAAGLAGFIGLAGCLIVIMLCFGYAYLLYWAGVWGGLGGAYGFTALTIAFLAALAGFFAWRRVGGMTRMRRTRKTVADDIRMLRRSGGDTTTAVPAGTPAAELPGKTTRLGGTSCPPPIPRSRSSDPGHTAR
jgi:hypothetical protein